MKERNIFTILEEERIERRKRLLKDRSPDEKIFVEYHPEEGTYDVKIDLIKGKTNVNGTPYVSFVCHNIKGKGEKLYASYYLTEATEEVSISDLRNLLFDYGYADFSDEEMEDDYSIIEHLQVLVGKKAKLVIEDQNGFLTGKVFKDVSNV